MSAASRPFRARLATAAVLLLLASGIPLGSTATDPCAATRGLAAVGERVCHDGRTVHVAAGEVRVARAGTHAGVDFVAFEALGEAFALLGAAGVWSPALPGAAELRLRTPALRAGAADGDPYRLVQLWTPMTQAWHDALHAAGVTLHAFVPDHAFLARLPDAGAETAEAAVAGLPFVQRVAALAPAAKLEPGLAAREGTLLVHALAVPHAPGAHAAVGAALRGLGAEVVLEQPELDRHVAAIDAARLAALAAVPDVWWVDEASLEPQADLDNIRPMTGALTIDQAPGDFRGQGVVGMVMDSGLDTRHSDFGRLLAVDGPNAADSHGTAVFGIVFGTGANNQAATGFAHEGGGVFAWWSSGLSRYQHAKNLADKWGGVFHTNSWGRGVPKDNTYDSLSHENDRVVFDLDVLMLQSMSNCGPLCARREAMAKNILSIGALYHRDTFLLQDDTWATGEGSRASTGPAADGRIKPELAGPYDFILTTALNGGYTSGFGGTSGATPVVAGTVALTNQMYRAGVFGANPGGATPSPAAVKALLLAGAEPWLPSQVVPPVPPAPVAQARDPMMRNVQGWGLPDLARMHRAGAAGATMVVDETARLRTGDAATFTFGAPPGAAALRVSLVWTDVPANPGAFKTLVNDLDLEVRDPTGQVVYVGNAGLLNAPFSAPGAAAAPDRVNNFENVFVTAPAPGPWTVTVRGAAVNLDGEPSTAAVDQPFGLAVLADPCGPACPAWFAPQV